jgi:hypothetical protein
MTMTNYHIIPVNDIKRHVEKATCKCSPRVIIENGQNIYVHNSYDGREIAEEAAEQIENSKN